MRKNNDGIAAKKHSTTVMLRRPGSEMQLSVRYVRTISLGTYQQARSVGDEGITKPGKSIGRQSDVQRVGLSVWA